MKTTEPIPFFFRCVAWSWFVFAVIAAALELWRPSFVSYLIQWWVILLIAGLAGMISVINKPRL